MSVLTDLIYGGSNAMVGLAEGAVNEAIAKYGAQKEIAFPETACYYPAIYAVTGLKVTKLEDLPLAIRTIKEMISRVPDIDEALHAGIATLLGAEIMEGLKYIEGDPYADDPGIGFVSDAALTYLSDDTLPDSVILIGREDDPEIAVEVVKTYQEKGILTFLVGEIIGQCIAGGIKMGMAARVIPLGQDVTAVIHGFNAAIRGALLFGGVEPGDLPGVLAYTRTRVNAVVNTFGSIHSVVVSACAGAIAMGFPAVVDIPLKDHQIPGALEAVCDHAETTVKTIALLEKQNT